MRGAAKVLEKVAQHALTGRGAHTETGEVFSGVDWKTAGTRPRGAPHSLFQIVRHMAYWQDWVAGWLDGKEPSLPRHASGSWPGGVAPSSRREWEGAVKEFRRGLAGIARRSRDSDLLSARGGRTRLEMIQTIGAHNSYHAGQAVILRQILGKWPPPSGGLAW